MPKMQAQHNHAPVSSHVAYTQYWGLQEAQSRFSTAQCRKCGRCIMDMDHHCLFLNNCVGRNNLQPFLLFLAWLLLGALYIVGTVSYLLYQRWDQVCSHTDLHKLGCGLLLWSMRLYWKILVAPGWLQTSAFLLSTATGAVLGVSGLLKSQLSLLMAGQTYIASLQHSSSPVSPQQYLSWTQLQQALMHNVCWSWLCPVWRIKGRICGSKLM